MVFRLGKLAISLVVACLLVASLTFATTRAWALEQGQEEKDQEEKGQEEKGQEVLFIEVPSLSAPVIRDGRLSFFLYLRLNLVVEDPETLALVESQLPRLKDAFLLVLHRGPLLEPEGQQVDLDALVERLKEMANHTLGEDLVQKVVVADARKG